MNWKGATAAPSGDPMAFVRMAVPESPGWAAAEYGYRNPLLDITPGPVLSRLTAEAWIVTLERTSREAARRPGLPGGSGA